MDPILTIMQATPEEIRTMAGELGLDSPLESLGKEIKKADVTDLHDALEKSIYIFDSAVRRQIFFSLQTILFHQFV